MINKVIFFQKMSENVFITPNKPGSRAVRRTAQLSSTPAAAGKIKKNRRGLLFAQPI